MTTSTERLRSEFARTTCDCHTCVTCCKHMPGALAPGDFEQIAAFKLGPVITPEAIGAFLLANFEASEGASAIVRDTSGEPAVLTIPSIVPKLTEAGCVFLKDGSCAIHAVAPFGCSHCDTHMPREESSPRVKSLVLEQFRAWQAPGDRYPKLWNILHDSGNRAKPLAARREAMDAALTLERVADGGR